MLDVPFVVTTVFVYGMTDRFVRLPGLIRSAFVKVDHGMFNVVTVTIVTPLMRRLLFHKTVRKRFLRAKGEPNVTVLLSTLVFNLVRIGPTRMPFTFYLKLMFK